MSKQKRKVITNIFACMLLLVAMSTICKNITLTAQTPLPFNIYSIDSTSVEDLLNKAENHPSNDTSRIFYLTALEQSRQINFIPGKTKAYFALINSYRDSKDMNSALRYALEALQFFEKNNNRRLIFSTLLSIAEIYQHEAIPEKAIEYYRRAANVPGIRISKVSNADINLDIAYNFSNNNQPDSANYYLLVVKKYYEEEENTEGAIKCLQQLALFHAKFNNYSEAIHYNVGLLNLLKAKNDVEQQALIYNNIGYNYHELSEYKNAISYFELAAELADSSQLIDKPGLYINMAIAYSNLGNSSKSNQYFYEALKQLPDNDIAGRAEVEHLLSNNYLNKGDIYNALRYNETAIELSKLSRNDYLLSRTYFTAAQIQKDLYDYEAAFGYNQKYQQLQDSFRLEELLNQQKLLQQQQLLERSEREISLLLVNQEVQQLTIEQLKLAEEKKSLEVQQLALANKAQEDELRLAAQEKAVQETELKNKQLEADRTRQQLALSQQQLLAAKRDQEISNLKQIELEQQGILRQKEAVERQRLREIERLDQDKQIAQEKLKQEAKFRRFVYIIGALATLTLLLILGGLLYFRKASQMLSQQNQQIEAQKQELEVERNVSEQLLLNILPQQTAHELKTKGKATTRKYDMVSVIFTDFRDFTSLASGLDAEELVETLNIYFMAFDQILENHGLEKIKTIGDAYMCVAGLPTPLDDHATRAVNAALEMQDYVIHHQPRPSDDPNQRWRMRLGIHSGPIVAGVVGSKKFAYDVWGDTVNVASRMESSGSEGRVNISETTYQLVKDKFTFTYRGEIEAKGKGEIAMYFVDQPI